MNVARRVAITAAVVGWMYGWFLLRGVRNEYATGDLGATPGGLLLMLLLITFVTIATAVVAGLRLRTWPVLAVAAGILLVAGILAAQYFPLRSYADRHGIPRQSVTLGEVATVALRNRTPAGVVVATATPMVLVLSGLSGLMLGRIPPRRPLPRDVPQPPGS